MQDSTAPLPSSRRVSRRVRGLQRLCARLPEAALLWSGGRVRHVNDGARTLLGCGAGEVDAQALQSLLAVLPRSGAAAAPGAATVLGADGELRTLRVAAVPVQRSGHRAQIWLLQDISADAAERDLLQRSYRQLARLSAGVDAEQQHRRRHVAMRVHDELLQPLAAIQMRLESVLGGAGSTWPDTAAQLQGCADIARGAMATGRDIVRALGSPMLVELGLAAALESLAGGFAQRHQIRCGFHARGVDAQGVPASAAAVHCLYRVAEEALANVAEHARAGQVCMRLAGDRHGGLSLQVRDDGVGMAADAHGNPQAIGLPVLEQRLRALGGRLTVRSAPGAGTTLTARLPGASRPLAERDPDPPNDTPDAALIRFFYRLPVGLVQAALDGQIALMNPAAANRLLPLSPDGMLDNLFAVLATAAPQLAAQAQALQQPDGVLCDSLRIQCDRARPFWLTVTKQAGARWMAVLGELPATSHAVPL